MSTVLIVDDEEGLLEVISDVIAALGHVPVMAHDGLEAWALAKEHRPDLILSDQMMPRLTGVELMRQVRRDAGLQNIPFILMSAASPSGADQATRFLRKPVDLDTLEDAIRAALDHHAAARPGVQPPAVAVPMVGPRRDLLLWIGHEVRTPMAAARLNAEVLARHIGAGDASNRARAQALVGQLTVLSETLASLIDIAELMDGGRMPLRDQDLSRLAAEVAADWRSRCPGATVNVRAPSRPLLARVDGDRIRRVMNTLLANWMRRAGPRATIDLSLDSSGGGAVLRMTSVDGIPEVLMNQSLDPDQLAHSGVEDPSVLPLYIAAIVARAHQGTLVVSEEADRRATVSLQLPSA